SLLLSSALLHDLAVQINVEALDLDRLVDPQPHDGFDDHENYEGGYGAPDDGCDDAVDLQRHLRSIPFQKSRRAADRLDRKYARQDGADDAAYAVNAEHVEAIVVA